MFLALLDGRFRLLVIGDVFDRRDETFRLPITVPDERLVYFHPKDAGILVLRALLRGKELNLSGEQPRQQSHLSLQAFPVGDLPDVLSQHIPWLAADDFAITFVCQIDSAFEADLRHAPAGLMKNGAKSLFALPQHPFRAGALPQID